MFETTIVAKPKARQAIDATNTGLFGQRVRAYWNLHKSCYSVQVDGIVVRHTSKLYLEDVRLYASEAGRRRVLAEGRKNVHAYVEGTLVHLRPVGWPVTLSYNPHKDAGWVQVDSITGERTPAPSVWGVQLDTATTLSEGGDWIKVPSVTGYGS